ncbi:MAG: hypothetical protein SH819_01070 [Cytophagales bacterium]|nr:hypothetical protein [Cytophagales bacterium]
MVKFKGIVRSSGIFAALLLVLLACGTKRTETTDNSLAFDSVKLTPYSGYTAVAVTHEVGDFKTWLLAYKSLSNPESRLSIYSSPEDPNLVTIFELTKSHADAKSAFASAEFKENLLAEGVTSDPIFNFFDVKFRALSTTPKTYRLGVSHEVEDYDRWKKIFDEDEPTRAKANLELRAISTNAESPRMVNILFATDDFQKAKDVINSEELKKRMEMAGVKTEPVFIVFRVPDKEPPMN